MVYPLKYVYVTVPFGRPGDWAAGKHTGTDFRASVGTSVYSTWHGVVEHVGWGGYGAAYGYHVIVRSKTRTGSTRKVLYAHLSGAGVRTGQAVKAGQYLGKSGATGRTFGAHLHYEERVSPYGYYNYAAPVFLHYDSKPDLPVVHLANLKPGKKNKDVRRVRRRLRKKGMKPGWGRKFNRKFQDAYARWQRKLGYSGKEANGIPGRTSLGKLDLEVK